MISRKMTDAINRQINRELYSAYLYLSMASFASSAGLRGFSGWFNVQAREELSHAVKLFDYVAANGPRVLLDDIEKPPQDFLSAADLFEKTLAHEKKVTALINDLLALSKEEKDKATGDFLMWFVKEQEEEEESAAKALEKVKAAAGDKAVLMTIDSELAKRKL